MRLLLLVMFIGMFSFGKSQSKQKDVLLDVKYNIHSINKKEYAEIKISYKNNTNPLYLWVQNWRLLLLDQPEDKFDYFPYGNVLMNAIAILPKRVDDWKIEKPISDIDYFDTVANCSFIKKINPRETFNVIILTYDSALIATLLRKDSEYLICYTYTKKPIKNKNGSKVDENSEVFLKSTLLPIFFWGAPENGSEKEIQIFNITSKDVATNRYDFFNLNTSEFKTNIAIGSYQK